MEGSVDLGFKPSDADYMSSVSLSSMREYIVPDGMALSVFHNKYSRKKADGSMQSYAERVSEVVDGNFLMDPRWKADQDTLFPNTLEQDHKRTKELAVAGVMPFSGRHLQHGDLDQPNKLMELHTNCSTAIFSFMLFRLLLRGSGVGRDYSATTCRVNWDYMPNMRLVLDESHPDYGKFMNEFHGSFESLKDAKHKYDSESENVRWFTVEDSREGWSKVIEILETAAWQEKHKDKLFIFNFTLVREEGAPINGLQGRPASGPLSFMRALAKIQSIKGIGMKPWKQALFIDHYLAACVQMGGARRSARMATKSWRDRDIQEFIEIKQGGFLWSSNNSILVDSEFWETAMNPRPSHARRVLDAALAAAYYDNTGEPGFINVDKLHADNTGMENITGQNYINRAVYGDLHERTCDMIDNVLAHIMKLEHPYIVNPCGEIVLATYGAYCVIGDISLAHVKSLDEAIDAAKLMSKFLIRVNRMDSEYKAEVERSNRIGVALTGIHEFAWNMFGLTFRDMISYHGNVFNNENNKLDGTVAAFWNFIDKMREAAMEAAASYSKELGLNVPHTVTTIKPSGTVSKVMNCTEGAHLPALAYYMRWVQYMDTDPALTDLQARGYPVMSIGHKYANHSIVGFPTKQPITDLMGSNVVTADEATPEENFQWLQLLEHFWLGRNGENNQISYTLKYSPKKVSFDEFRNMILKFQPHVRCCSVLPTSDIEDMKELFGYVPEEPIDERTYNEWKAIINVVQHEAYDNNTLMCAGGVCAFDEDRYNVTDSSSKEDVAENTNNSEEEVYDEMVQYHDDRMKVDDAINVIKLFVQEKTGTHIEFPEQKQYG